MNIDDDMWALRYESSMTPSSMSTAGQRMADEIDRLRARIAELEAERVQILAKSMDRRRRLTAVIELCDSQVHVPGSWFAQVRAAATGDTKL